MGDAVLRHGTLKCIKPRKAPWYFGMKARIGTDRDSGMVHNAIATLAVERWFFPGHPVGKEDISIVSLLPLVHENICISFPILSRLPISLKAPSLLPKSSTATGSRSSKEQKGSLPGKEGVKKMGVKNQHNPNQESISGRARR